MALAQKRCILDLWLLQNTNKKAMLEIEPTSQRGHKATKSGENVLEAEKHIVNILKPANIEPWSLLNENNKS